MHRRQELNERIKVFVDKCDYAIHGIEKLKKQAKSFVEHLNCEPSDLKERFLNCMKNLDEYNYLITDFTLAIDNVDSSSRIGNTPDQDESICSIIPESVKSHLLDTISEPKASTSKPMKYKSKKIPREDKLLITFSSTSCSSESVPITNTEKEFACEIEENIKKFSLDDSSTECNLPAQSVLQVDSVHPAVIVHVDGISFWVITDDLSEVCNLMTNMTNYYMPKPVQLTLDQIMALTYCAFYDNDGKECYYRALFIRLCEDDMNMAEVFLVDTGETRRCQRSYLQPLWPRFATSPPFGRCCHLAGPVSDALDNDNIIEKYLMKYVGTTCKIKIDDNTSESLGVYVLVQNALCEYDVLNDVILKEGLALQDGKASQGAAVKCEFDKDNFNITNCPEFYDPLEAVTGYHNRDEMDICKHYKGGPDKTCFKGSRCTKKHIMMHPDGWTLDRIPVVAKYNEASLPAPDTWNKVRVTHVAHFDCFYAHIIDETKQTSQGPPAFGVVLPPMTLDDLVTDMNSMATRTAYKPLKIVPAPGELVAALYLDDMWYRARVVSSTRADQNVEVKYIDYGNVIWVKEDEIRELDPRYWALEAQACRCVLAGIVANSSDSKHWAAAREHLARLINEKTFQAHVIAREYDEIIVELYDDNDQSIAELLATGPFVKLQEYSVIQDVGVSQKIIVP